MTQKRGDLSRFAAQKAGSGEEIQTASKPDQTHQKDNRKLLTLRLSPEAWEQAKILSVKERTTLQKMLCEALNDHFAKHKLQRLA